MQTDRFPIESTPLLSRKPVSPLKWFAIAGVASIGVAAFATADAPAPEFHVLKSIAVGGDGGWDYVTVSSAAHRLYVPRATHVQVIDLDSDKVIQDWQGTQGVHGVALVPDKGLAFTSNGRSGNVSVFVIDDGKKIADVKAGTGPDAIAYDAASSKVLAMNHRGGTITFITIGDDKSTFTTQDLEVGGALEGVAFDGAGHAFVNVEDKNEVVEVDTKAGTVLAHWTLGDGTGPTGIAMDLANHRLFVGCGGNGKMVVLDAVSGKVLAAVAIGQRCDGCDFDPGTSTAFASCGDGTLAMVHESATAGQFDVQSVKTVAGARTIALDPDTHRVYMPTADYNPAQPGQNRPTVKPGSFKIVVVGNG